LQPLGYGVTAATPISTARFARIRLEDSAS
jgi:hypothetical protein